MTVRLPIENLGTPVLIINGIEKPWGVTINQRGVVMVTDWGEHRVSVFTAEGKKIRSFGGLGTGQEQFIRPSGLAVDSEGNLLVTDTLNHRVQKYTAEGQFITSVGTKGSGCLQFFSPINITLGTDKKKIYILEEENNRVQVLNSDLTFSSKFGGIGRGKGKFMYPRGIACDNTGKVYVADTRNHRIQIFTAKGKFVKMFGMYGDDREN